jgi:biopolymer transport protein ExbD
MSLGLRARPRHRPELPLVPLIDVLVMLVFFTFATMQFRERTVASINLTLPKVETAGVNEFTSPIIIGIAQEGAFMVNGVAASDAEMAAVIRKSSDLDNEMTVLIKADEKTPLERVTRAMDICRKNGLNKIRLQSR